jgi:Phospholipase_D-nuclease N-terminal
VIRALPWLLSLVLMIWCLIDCIQTPARDVRYLPKVGWIVVILLFSIIGSVAWLLAGRPRRASSGGASSRPSPRPQAPDDDPDFLRRLDWERWRRQRGEESGPDTGGPLPE